MTNFIQLDAFCQNCASSRQGRSTASGEMNLLVQSRSDRLVGLCNVPMTAVDPLFTTMGEGRQADAGAEKAAVAPDPMCGKVLDRLSTMLQENQNRLSSDLILDYPRTPGYIGAAITSA